MEILVFDEGGGERTGERNGGRNGASMTCIVAAMGPVGFYHRRTHHRRRSSFSNGLIERLIHQPTYITFRGIGFVWLLESGSGRGKTKGKGKGKKGRGRVKGGERS